jgi:hypothetical protein
LDGGVDIDASGGVAVSFRLLFLLFAASIESSIEALLGAMIANEESKVRGTVDGTLSLYLVVV